MYRLTSDCSRTVLCFDKIGVFAFAVDRGIIKPTNDVMQLQMTYGYGGKFWEYVKEKLSEHYTITVEEDHGYVEIGE